MDIPKSMIEAVARTRYNRTHTNHIDAWSELSPESFAKEIYLREAEMELTAALELCHITRVDALRHTSGTLSYKAYEDKFQRLCDKYPEAEKIYQLEITTPWDNSS